MTKPRKHIGILPGLPFSARRWLLGARVYYDDNDELRNSGIVRLQHLIVRSRGCREACNMEGEEGGSPTSR